MAHGQTYDLGWQGILWGTKKWKDILSVLVWVVESLRVLWEKRCKGDDKMPGLIQGIGSMLTFRQRMQEQAEEKRIAAQKDELEFRMKLAEKTDNWEPFHKWLNETYPGMGLEAPSPPKVGGVTKKVPVTADLARGDIATKEVVEGGIAVTPKTKEKFDLAGLYEKLGVITPEQKTEYLAGVKPTPWQQKKSLLEGIQGLAEDDPMRMATEKMVGGWVDKKKAPKVQTVGVPGKPGMRKDLQWNKKRSIWEDLAGPYYPTIKTAEGAKAKEKKGAEYTLAQRLDDLRSTYKMKLQALDREFGYEVQGQFFIKPESMEVYKAARERIMREYFEDERLVRAGKKPKYLEEPTEKIAPPPELMWKYVPGQGMVRIK